MNYLLLAQDVKDVVDTIENVSNGLESIENSTSSLYGILLLIPELLGIASGAFFFILSVIGSIFGLIIAVVEFIIPAIALFKMARKAGFKYPWLAFIPVAQTYLEYILPRREFKLGFKTKNRTAMAIVALILTYFGTTVIVILNVIPGLGQLLDVLLPVILLLFAWRKRYDMLVTFKDKELAVPISILGIFFPIVYSITLLIISKRDPEYGAGNYYYVDMSSKPAANNAQAYPNAPVYPNGQMYQNAPVYQNGQVYQNAPVYQNGQPQMYAQQPQMYSQPQMYAQKPQMYAQPAQNVQAQPQVNAAPVQTEAPAPAAPVAEATQAAPVQAEAPAVETAQTAPVAETVQAAPAEDTPTTPLA